MFMAQSLKIEIEENIRKLKVYGDCKMGSEVYAFMLDIL